MFKDRFWISLLLTIPVIAYGDMIQMWFGYRAPVFAGSTYIPPVFGTAVFPTCHGVNPTLTMWAVCYRAAEHLIENFKL